MRSASSIDPRWRRHLSGQHGSLHGRRQGDRAKKLFRTKIILARFIDDAEQAVFLGGGITKRDIILRFSSETA
jgi:hypothetical protein